MKAWTEPWNTTDTPVSRCPFCGYRSEAASAPGDASPEPGHIAVCISCASVLMFDDSLQLRAMTQTEFADLHPDNRKEILLIQRGIRMLDRRRLKGHHFR